MHQSSRDKVKGVCKGVFTLDRPTYGSNLGRNNRDIMSDRDQSVMLHSSKHLNSLIGLNLWLEENTERTKKSLIMNIKLNI